MKTQVEKALEFQKLHEQGIFVLGNVWNPGIGRIFANNGFKALATTSAGVAYSFGYKDGEHLPISETLKITAAIVNSTDLPVSVDIERGYGNSPEEIKQTVKSVLDVGGVGINIEDSVTHPDKLLIRDQDMIANITAVCQLKQENGIPFVINARTDSFLFGFGDEVKRLASSIERGNHYMEAGADCIFIPGVLTKKEIQTLATEIHGPINVLAVPGTPSIAELHDLGVRRISLGSRPINCVLKLVDDLSRSIMVDGSFSKLDENTISYAEANQFFTDSSNN